MDFIIRLAEEFFKKHKRLARYRRIFAFLAAVVVFATTYELILPAITMDRQRAFQSPGVEVGVAKDQRKGIEFTEDDSFAADSAGEDAFEAGFSEEGDFFEDDTGVAGDGYVEDFSSDGTGSADDWMQAENPGAGDTWENEDEIVPGADSAGDDYSGSDADGSLTDADGTGVNASAGDDLAGVPSDSSDPENSGADISVPENEENDNTDESTDLTDGNGTDSEEAGLEGTGSASHEDGQDLETADGEDLEDASDASSENISGDNTQDASTGASTADSKETDDTTDNNSNKGDTVSGSTVAGSTTAGSGEAVIEGGTAETAVEFAQDGAAAGATDLAALDATGQAAIAVTYPATITYEGKDYTITATFDEKAKLPAEVTLSAVEILPDKVYKDENGNPLYAGYEEYYQKTLEALEKEKRLDNDQTVATARFFDITFLDKDGKTVEPAAPVSIAVKYKDALSAVDTADTMAVHFDDTAKVNNSDKDIVEKDKDIVEIKDGGDNDQAEIAVPEILDTKTEVKKKAIQEISFEAERFSVYGVIGTEIIEKTVLASDGNNYKVTVTYGVDAEIPKDASLEVTEITKEARTYGDYVAGTETALGWAEGSTGYIRLFDIRIVDKDGQKVEIKAPVSVEIRLADKEDSDKTQVVHFAGDGVEGNVVDDVNIDGESVSFKAEGFSVYAVAGQKITVAYLTADGKTLKVTATFDDSEPVPANATLEVREISKDDEDWGERSARLASVLSDKYGNVTISDARFLSIDIMVDGEKYKPEKPVKVRIEYIEPLNTEDTIDYGNDLDGNKIIPKEKDSRFVTIHYTEGGAELIESENSSSDQGITETSYETPGFSDYDFVYMYDYDTYEAGDDYSLSEHIHTAKEVVVPALKAARGTKAAGNVPAHEKTLSDNDNDGVYTLGLSVTGDADTNTNTASNANVVIIYDVSTSMTYNYIPMATGGRGIDTSSATSFQDGEYFQLYRIQGNSYVAITDDTYTGTVYRRTVSGYGYWQTESYSEYDGQRYSYSVYRADAGEKVVYDFTHALFGYQDSNNPTNIQAAFITFADKVYTNTGWTSTESEITNNVYSSGTQHHGMYHNYTNWKGALDAAYNLIDGSTTDADPTYVVFVTDGRPQTTGESDAKTNYLNTIERAANIQTFCDETGGAFYGIYAFGKEQDWLASLMYYAYNESRPSSDLEGETFDTEGYYKASDSEALTQAINSIFQRIVQTLGVGSVSITDGTTSHVETSSGQIAHLLEVDNQSYQYWLSLPVNAGGGGSYTFSMPDKLTAETVTYTVRQSGDNITITWEGGTATYPGTIKTGNVLTMEWTGATPFYNVGPPAASFNADTGAVDWNLSSVGTLLDGVTYQVTFDVFPSQNTLDLIADLKNDPSMYDGLDSKIKDYLKPNNDGTDYVLSTNTNATLAYTDTRTEEGPQEETYINPPPVDTVATEVVTLSKDWSNSIDDKEKPESLTMHITRDGVNKYELVLNDEDLWEDQAFISFGIMTVHGDTVSVKAPGHDFAFTEPPDLEYHWELQAPVLRPMLINTVPTMLVKIEDSEAPGGLSGDNATTTVGGVTYYKLTIGGKTEYYKVDSSSGSASLHATNHRRSYLDVKKEVTGGNAPEDDKFEFTMTVNNSHFDHEDSVASNLDSDYWVWFSVMDADGGMVISDGLVSLASGSDGELHRQTDSSSEEYNGYYYMKSGSTITVKMQKGYNLRFINLPTESTYTISEGSLPGESYTFDSIVGKKDNSDTGTVSGQSISGTIDEPDSVYTVTVTNKYYSIDVQLEKDDNNGSPLSGAVFNLARYKDEAWAAVKEGIEPGGTIPPEDVPESDTDDTEPAEEEVSVTIGNPVDLGGLGIGRYKLTEVHAPDGYIITNRDIYFQVYKDNTGKICARLTDSYGSPIESLTGVSFTKTSDGDPATYLMRVQNTPGSELPVTGGTGRKPYTLCGVMFAMTAALMYVFRMRRRERRLR